MQNNRLILILLITIAAMSASIELSYSADKFHSSEKPDALPITNREAAEERAFAYLIRHQGLGDCDTVRTLYLEDNSAILKHKGKSWIVEIRRNWEPFKRLQINMLTGEVTDLGSACIFCKKATVPSVETNLYHSQAANRLINSLRKTDDLLLFTQPLSFN